MGLLKVRKVAGTERSRFQLDFNMTGRLDLVKLEPACPAAAGAEFDQIQVDWSY
jgi:hypothetical protein